MATINEIAQQINESKQPITLIYAFNSTGKTKLCVEYKNLTKKKDGSHAGIGDYGIKFGFFGWVHFI